jgi:hypothetical protein
VCEEFEVLEQAGPSRLGDPDEQAEDDLVDAVDDGARIADRRDQLVEADGDRERAGGRTGAPKQLTDRATGEAK